MMKNETTFKAALIGTEFSLPEHRGVTFRKIAADKYAPVRADGQTVGAVRVYVDFPIEAER